METFGAAIAAQFGELPFLFKLLCAMQPLSIQVHQSKPAAEQDFAKEKNSQSRSMRLIATIRMPQPHKPELVFALTPFQRNCGAIAARSQCISVHHHLLAADI
ncbi:MAG: type I phosphomannose isomerase catalytic subunit [Symbiopectobacterium sp.]